MMPSIPQLLIVLVIVVLLFGAKRLRTLGGDLGGAVKGFKKAMGDEDEKAAQLEDAASDTANDAANDLGEAVESTVARESDESKV